jgi:hypothetical protein
MKQNIAGAHLGGTGANRHWAVDEAQSVPVEYGADHNPGIRPLDG